MNLVTTVYEQQRIMQETHTHRIPGRIVSLFQPWIRPIVRGKAHANTKFGAKSTSACPTVIFALSGWTSSPTTKRKISTGLWSVTGNAMDIILSGYWQTRFTVTAKLWHIAKNAAFGLRVRPWESPLKIKR